MNCLKFGFVSAVFLSCLGNGWGLTHIGERAPAIHVSHVVSPTTQSLSPAALAGKTVVVDFWATWCGPCVASMPHMNELEASLDPKKFMFIALDDESEDVVERFLAKRKISSIVALDRNNETFSAFGVASRPATIVIDPKGKVALVTPPMDLTAKELLAISNGEKSASMEKPSVKTVAAHAAPETKADAPATEAPLAGVLLRKKLPSEKAYTFEHDSEGKQTYVGFEAKVLVGMALAVPGRRVKYVDDLPSGSYDLSLNLGDVDEATKSAILTAVVEKAFDLDIKKSDSMQDVLVLRRSEDAPLKLQQTFDSASAHGVQQNGSDWAFSNFTISQVGSYIEDKYGVAVVDETGLSGGFDGSIPWPETKEQLNEVLRNNLGLEATTASRAVATFTVSKRK